MREKSEKAQSKKLLENEKLISASVLQYYCDLEASALAYFGADRAMLTQIAPWLLRVDLASFFFSFFFFLFFLRLLNSSFSRERPGRQGGGSL